MTRPTKGGRGRQGPLGSVPEKPSLEPLNDVVSAKVLTALHDAQVALHTAGIDFWIIGGLAVGAWGHPRATKDVDFLVRQNDAFDLHGKLVTFKPGIPIEANGVAIDYLTAEGACVADLFPGNIGQPIAPIEVLFLLKLQAGRMQDRADIVALIQAGADVRAIGAWLTRRADPEELRLFERLVEEARR